MAEPIDTLKTRIAELKAANALNAEGQDNLYSKVIVAYVDKVLTELEGIFNQRAEIDEDVINQLSTFFNANWMLIKGTAVCYTALPSHDLTGFLGEVAQLVVDFKNQQIEANGKQLSIVNVLMPTVVIETDDDDYEGDLGPYQEIDQARSKWIIYVDENDRTIRQFSPYLVWMNTPVDITQVLHTHILSCDGFSLLPVHLLTKLETGADVQKVNNPYHDYHNDAMSPYLNEDELIRLGQHSPSTIAVFEAKKRYELCLNDTNNLLGNLRQLCTQLTFNSAHGGVGSQANAGMGAYGAIIAFNEYYESLGDSVNSIPQSLKTEIDLLLELSSNAARNINATENMQTCIGTRAEHLAKEIKTHEAVLSTIGLSGEKKQELLEKARSEFDSAKSALQQELAAYNQYTRGADKLGINRELLQALKVEASISSVRDLKNFQTLMPSEITDLFQIPGLRRQFLKQINSLENLVVFIHETSLDRLKAIFKEVGPSLFQFIVAIRPWATKQDLAALLMTMNSERCEIILESMSMQVTDLIRTASDLAVVLKDLDAEQQAAVIQFMSSRQPKLVRTFDELTTILESLHSEQRLPLLRLLKDNPPAVNSNEKMIKILSYYPFEQFSEVLALLKPKLKYATKAVESIKANIETGDKAQLIKKIGKLSIKDLMIFSIETPPEHLKPMLRELALHLCPKLVKSPEHLSVWLSTMNKECRDIVSEVLKEKYCTPKSTKWFLGVFQHLKREQQKDLLEVVKNKLPLLIQTPADLNSLLQVVDVEGYKTIYETLQPQFARRVSSIEDLRSVFRGLDVNQQSAFFKAIQGELPNLINSISDLEKLFASEVDVGRFLLDIVGQPVGGGAVLVFLLLNTLVQNLVPNVGHLLPHSILVNPSQRVFITNAIVAKLQTLINTPHDLLKTLKLIGNRAGGHALVLEAVKDKLADFIQESTDPHFRDTIFISLTPTLRSELYTKITRKPAPAEITDELLNKIRSARVPIIGSRNPFNNSQVNQRSSDKQKALQPLMMQFELALANDEPIQLKRAFDELYQVANTHRSKVSFFQKGTTRSSEQLLEGLSKMRVKQHVRTLNTALGLNLREEALKSPRAIKNALKSYLNTNSGSSPAISTDECTPLL